MSEQCSKRVFSDGWGGHQCMRQAITVEDGKPVCRQHTAAAKADREAKSAVRYQAYLRRVNAPGDRLRALNATNASLLAALEAWRNGYFILIRKLHEIEQHHTPTYVDCPAPYCVQAREMNHAYLREATLDVQKEAKEA